MWDETLGRGADLCCERHLVSWPVQENETAIRFMQPRKALLRPVLSPPMLRTLGALGVLAGTIVLFFWKLVFTHQFDWIWGPDLAQQVLPWLEIEARQVHSSHLPLWDSSFWCGQ